MREKQITYILEHDEDLIVDKMGNYVDYEGLNDNLIGEKDDLAVMQSKVQAQERWLINNGYTSMDMLDYMEKTYISS